MLADYNLPSREFVTEGGSFSVKGLSVVDFNVLVRTHFADLEALFDLFAQKDRLENADVTALCLAAVESAPGFVANVIALAAGEPHAAPVVQRMSAPFQVLILEAVGELTFTEVGGVKKFLPVIARLLPKTAGLKEKVAMNLQTRLKGL